MPIEPPEPGIVLDNLRAALTELRALAALPTADPFYARSAEEISAIVSEFENRLAPSTTQR